MKALLDRAWTRRRVAGPILALAALVLVGSLAALAAPGSSPAPNRVASSGAPAVASHAATATTATRVAPHGAQPLVDTPVPTPTDTPPVAPTATPIPPATPTATPAPSWHTIATYSGSAPQSLSSFATSAPWRMVWSCTPAAGTGFSFTLTADGSTIGAFGDTCDGASPTSGTWQQCADGSCGSHTFAVTVGQNGPNPEAGWSAIIQEYS